MSCGTQIGVGVGVNDGVAVGTEVTVGAVDGVGVFDGLGVGVRVSVGVNVGGNAVGDGVRVAVGEGVWLGVGDGVFVGEGVDVGMSVGINVAVGIGLGVSVALGIGVADGMSESVGVIVPVIAGHSAIRLPVEPYNTTEENDTAEVPEFFRFTLYSPGSATPSLGTLPEDTAISFSTFNKVKTVVETNKPEGSYDLRSKTTVFGSAAAGTTVIAPIPSFGVPTISF